MLIPLVDRSIHRDAAGLNRPGPFLDLGLDKSLQVIRGAALARDEVGADVLHSPLHGGGVDGGEDRGMELVDNRR